MIVPNRVLALTFVALVALAAATPTESAFAAKKSTKAAKKAAKGKTAKGKAARKPAEAPAAAAPASDLAPMKAGLDSLKAELEAERKGREDGQAKIEGEVGRQLQAMTAAIVQHAATEQAAREKLSKRASGEGRWTAWATLFGILLEMGGALLLCGVFLAAAPPANGRAMSRAGAVLLSTGFLLHVAGIAMALPSRVVAEMLVGIAGLGWGGLLWMLFGKGAGSFSFANLKMRRRSTDAPPPPNRPVPKAVPETVPVAAPEAASEAPAETPSRAGSTTPPSAVPKIWAPEEVSSERTAAESPVQESLSPDLDLMPLAPGASASTAAPLCDFCREEAPLAVGEVWWKQSVDERGELSDEPNQLAYGHAECLRNSGFYDVTVTTSGSEMPGPKLQRAPAETFLTEKMSAFRAWYRDFHAQSAAQGDSMDLETSGEVELRQLEARLLAGSGRRAA